MKSTVPADQVCVRVSHKSINQQCPRLVRGLRSAAVAVISGGLLLGQALRQLANKAVVAPNVRAMFAAFQ